MNFISFFFYLLIKSIFFKSSFSFRSVLWCNKEKKLREKLMSVWQSLLLYFLNWTLYYMFSQNQETNKIVNMTVLDLLIFYQKKLVCATTFYHLEIQDQVLHANVPLRSAF